MQMFVCDVIIIGILTNCQNDCTSILEFVILVHRLYASQLVVPKGSYVFKIACHKYPLTHYRQYTFLIGSCFDCVTRTEETDVFYTVLSDAIVVDKVAKHFWLHVIILVILINR